MQINDLLFSEFYSDSNSDWSYSSIEDSDRECESTQSKTESLIKYSEDSMLDNFSFKLNRSMNRDSIVPHIGDIDDYPNPFKETEMEFYTQDWTLNNKVNKNLVLTKESVCCAIEKELSSILKSTIYLFDKYIKLIEFNPFIAK